MNDKAKTKKELVLEVEELRSRLSEAEETLRAIRSGEVDALVVTTSEGEKVFTLAGADYGYRAMVEAMNEGAVTISRDGTILYCNMRFADMVKKRLETVIGFPFSKLLAPEAKNALDVILRREEEANESFEGSLRAWDGTIIPVNLSASSIKVNDSKAVCVVVTDLAEHKRNEKILHSAKLSRSIVEHSTEPILVCDEKGKIIQVSQIAHRHFPGGLLRKEFDSVCPLSIASPSPLQSTRFTISTVLSGKIIRSLEVAHGHEDTKESHFLLSARPLTHDGKAIIGCVVALVDITGRKQMEAELTRLASFPRLSPNPIVEVDLAGQVHYSNPAAEHLFPDLRRAGLDHPWLMGLAKVLESPEIHSRKPLVREVRVGESWYQQTIHSVLEGTRLRIYAFDITERKLAEDALRHEHDTLDALIRSIPDEVWFADSEGHFTLINPSGTREFDLGVDSTIDVRQMAAKLEVHRPDGTLRPIDEAPPLRALRGELVTNQEEWIRSPSTGEMRYRQINAAPVCDDTGNIIGSVSVARDITEHKRAETALKESEERLRRLIETSPVAIGLGDSKGRIFEANESFYRLTGYTREEIKAREVGWIQLTAPEYAEIDRQIMATLAVTGSVGPYEKEYIRKDGSRVPLLLSVSKFPGRDEHVAFILDITERKREEQERERLRVEAENEKRRLEAVMEALPVGVVLTDARGGSIKTNKAYEQLWGSPRPEVESINDYKAYKAWWSETGEPVAPEEWASAVAVQRGQTVVGQLMEIERFDGSRASVINSGAPVFDANGKIVGCAVAIQDISDLRRTEKALRESNARTATILDSISDGFMTLDNDLVVTYFNQAAEKLLGRKQEDVLGKNLFDAFPEARGSVFEEKYSRALNEKKVTAFETYFGVVPYENWYDVRVYPHDYGISAYFRVTTEEKKAAEAVRRNKERFELLAETASKLLETPDPQGLVNELCERVLAHLDCHAFFNYLVDPTKQRLHLNACAGIPEQTAKDIEWLDYGVAVCGCAARDASRIVCENIPVTPDPRTELVKSFGITAYACHPLFSEGRVIGTLSFGTRTRTTFTEDELSVMKTVADQVATAMERVRLLREIENSRDELERRVIERTEQLDMANASLKAERQLFYDVLETIPAYVVLLTPDYYAAFANRTFKERFGEPEDRRCFEFLFGRNEPCEVCETYTALKTMAPHEWEWAGPDGRIYFVHDFPFTNVNGTTLILEMGIDITERKRAEEELRNQESQLRFFASQCLTAQETERRRIAAELHDSIASALAGIKFRIEKTALDVERGVGTTEAMKELSSNMAHTIGEVRRIMTDLRPSILDDLGVLPALNWLCREYEKDYPQLSVKKHIGVSEEDVPDPLKIVIYRISQEAMNNLAKHSKASSADYALQKVGERLELTIHDNGCGFRFDEITKGFGLTTMRERAELSGGIFDIQSSKEKGTLIRASWPSAR